MVYSALLPDAVGGAVDPGCIATPLAASLPSTTVVVGTVASIDAAAQTCIVRRTDGEELRLTWDRLVLNPGAYRHKDLGFAVDLTGRNAIPTPLGVRLSGVLAKLAARAYHLLALPSGRLRVLSGWINAAISGPQIIELGLIDERHATIQAEASAGQELGRTVAGGQDV